MIGMELWDNQLNRKGVPWCIVPSDGEFQIQVEWTSGNFPTNPGQASMQILVGGVETCYNVAPGGGVQNGAFDIDQQGFVLRPEGGVLTTSSFYVDEFASFRTLAP